MAISAIGSFFAGTVCTLLIAVLGPPIAELALKFGSPEYFSLMLLALVMAAVLAQGSMLKSLAMVALGLLLGIVGADVDHGSTRFPSVTRRADRRIGFVIIAVGVFGIGEIICNSGTAGAKGLQLSDRGASCPTAGEFSSPRRPFSGERGSGRSSACCPARGGGRLFAFLRPRAQAGQGPGRFGHGAIEAVAGPESANNADAQYFVHPYAVIGGSRHCGHGPDARRHDHSGHRTRPAGMTQRPDLFGGSIASMWIGNLMLVILNLPLIGLWVSLLKVPYRLLFPSIMVFCAIGIYSTNNLSFDVYLAALFGILGILWRILEFSPIPVMLGFVLGPMLEENLRRALQVSNGNPMVFVTRPISLVFIVITVLILIVMVLPVMRRRRGDITD